MLWRPRFPARALAAAGLVLSVSTFAASAADEPELPRPGPEADTATVSILDAQKSGEVALKLRGHGQDKVHLAIRNTTGHRLNVVLPPGLVAASVTGQLQNMGLGNPSNAPGGFGGFRSAPIGGGMRSVPPAGPAPADAIAVPPGQAIELNVPAVCLNFGKPTPTPRDAFRLVDVDDYSTNPDVRRALRSLSTYGTSQGVAQAVMWRVCNDVPFSQMMATFGPKVVNAREAALAARFVEAARASGEGELVDPAYLHEARVFVRVQGEGTMGKVARRVGDELDGARMFGLPVRVAASPDIPDASAPALLLTVSLTGSGPGTTRGRVAVAYAAEPGAWTSLGQATFTEGSAPGVLEGSALAATVERAVASAFVVVKPARRSSRVTTLKIENRLPFTLTNVVVKAGESAGAASVPLHGLGIGPARVGYAPVEAANATVERVEFNGL